MKLPLYQIDAFANAPFTGNPAAVVPMNQWLDDASLQNIAMENNLAETAFIVPTNDPARWKLRWFTPSVEMPLCGHATFASGACIMRHIHPQLNQVFFDTLSGELVVERVDDGFTLDLPAAQARPWAAPDELAEALGMTPEDTVHGLYCNAVLKDETSVRGLTIESGVNAAEFTDPKGMLIVTAPGDDEFDFVLRFFANEVGIPEDPVTGGAYASVARYWAQKLGKTKMKSYQASARGGHLNVEVKGERVVLSGKAQDYMIGEISL